MEASSCSASWSRRRTSFAIGDGFVIFLGLSALLLDFGKHA